MWGRTTSLSRASDPCLRLSSPAVTHWTPHHLSSCAGRAETSYRIYAPDVLHTKPRCKKLCPRRRHKRWPTAQHGAPLHIAGTRSTPRASPAPTTAWLWRRRANATSSTRDRPRAVAADRALLYFPPRADIGAWMTRALGRRSKQCRVNSDLEVACWPTPAPQSDYMAIPPRKSLSLTARTAGTIISA